MNHDMHADSTTLKVDGHIPALNGVRGLAVLFVVLFHSFPVGSEHRIDRFASTLREPLWAGVDLFFVLSGFLITGILLDTREHKYYLTNFMGRRALRILPLFYGTLCVLFIGIPLLARATNALNGIISSNHYRVLQENQIWLWTYTQNFLQARGAHQLPGLGHFWSLAIEEQFYLLWPFVVMLVPRKSLLAGCFVFCLAIPAIRVAMLNHGTTAWAVRELTYTRVDSLLWGAIAAIVRRDANIMAIYERLRSGILASTILGISLVYYVSGGFGYELYHVQVFGYSLLGILFAVWMLQCTESHRKGNSMRILTSGVLPNLGRFSYALYVFHFPVAQFVRGGIGRFIANEGRAIPLTLVRTAEFCLIISISYAMAVASFYCYEKHFLRLKKYFSYASTVVSSSETLPVR